jgi:hypothetical protein
MADAASPAEGAESKRALPAPPLGTSSPSLGAHRVHSPPASPRALRPASPTTAAHALANGLIVRSRGGAVLHAECTDAIAWYVRACARECASESRHLLKDAGYCVVHCHGR